MGVIRELQIVLLTWYFKAKADEIAKLMNENEHLKSLTNDESFNNSGLCSHKGKRYTTRNGNEKKLVRKKGYDCSVNCQIRYKEKMERE
nr:golgin candidate 5 [Tanacetum cinerariifolium]